ncbi:hypothetical protein [Streptomyces sp. NPDC051776]|uniref:hypothetical protein n=1 Tax=Streptomyces sp. NPDC051776 TaxID=3155414 RepID=UPI003445C2EF
MSPTNNQFDEMNRSKLNQLIAAAGGRLPSTGSWNSPLLAQLYDEAAGQMGGLPLKPVDDRQPAQARWSAEDGYWITYDPAYEPKSYTDPGSFATATVLHELMHISTDKRYRHIQDNDLKWVNFHLPGEADSEELRGSMQKQMEAGEKNFGNLREILEQDARKGVLDRSVHEHLQDRITYGQATPHVHYDTVLTDIAAYMALNQKTDTDTYRYTAQLSQEAYNRRMNGAVGDELQVQPYNRPVRPNLFQNFQNFWRPMWEKLPFSAPRVNPPTQTTVSTLPPGNLGTQQPESLGTQGAAPPSHPTGLDLNASTAAPNDQQEPFVTPPQTPTAFAPVQQQAAQELTGNQMAQLSPTTVPNSLGGSGGWGQQVNLPGAGGPDTQVAASMTGPGTAGVPMQVTQPGGIVPGTTGVPMQDSQQPAGTVPGTPSGLGGA